MKKQPPPDLPEGRRKPLPNPPEGGRTEWVRIN